MAQEAKPRECKRCNRLLPIEAFERNRPNVWRSECKECRAYKTGHIRGYICNRCNTGLGNFDDNISILNRAIEWIKGTLISL